MVFLVTIMHECTIGQELQMELLADAAAYAAVDRCALSNVCPPPADESTFLREMT